MESARFELRRCKGGPRGLSLSGNANKPWAYPLRMAKYYLAAARHMAWADLVYAHTIDLPLPAGRDLPRVIKVVGDQAWERCVRKAWIPADMTIDDFQTFAGDWRIRWQKWSRSRQVASMDAVIVPSQYLKRMVTGWGVDPAKVRVIYNALPPAPAADETRVEIRARLNWSARPTIVTVARLQPWKGIDHLIHAIQQLPELRLVVVGEGPDRRRLEALAVSLEERVTFTGQLPRQQVHKLMRAADGVALYSAYEGLSHTLLESLQLGTPVLGSDRGGNAEVIKHGINGILAPHVDIAALRAGLQQLLDTRDLLAANCKEGLDRFDFGAMAHQTDTLLKSLLA